MQLNYDNFKIANYCFCKGNVAELHLFILDSQGNLTRSNLQDFNEFFVRAEIAPIIFVSNNSQEHFAEKKVVKKKMTTINMSHQKRHFRHLN